MRPAATLAVAALACLIATGNAWAWGNITGIVRHINHKTSRLILEDGRAYTVQDSIDLSKIRKGDVVRVSVQTNDGKNMANKIVRIARRR